MAAAALADLADLAVRAGSKNEEAAADRLPRKDWKNIFPARWLRLVLASCSVLQDFLLFNSDV